MEPTANPLISVVMPVYNALPFLDDSIKSILTQTFSDFEFVILDDASTDGSVERLREWAGRDSRKWLPETMSLRRYEGHHLTPFWEALTQQGVSVCVFDVPFAPPVGVTQGFDLPAYDWRKTRAFSLPTDQYGWIRINLIGRESLGVVPPEDYDNLCTELERMLLSLASEDGELLVQDVSRTAADAASARVNPLPDLVVHWRDAAFSSSLKIKWSKVQARMVSKKSTGQHTTPGFCIFRGNGEWGRDGVVDAKDLSRLITASL